MSRIVLELENCTVRYGAVPAVDGASVVVRSGEMVALLGANGAGKSSLLKAVLGLVRPSGGTVRLAGGSLDGLPPWRRARLGIGYSAEGRRVFPAMTVRENLEVAGEGGAAERGRRIEHVFGIFPALGAHRNAPAWRLSGGQQQMLAIGRALMRRASLLVLDEPSLGLSPALAKDVFTQLRGIAAGGAAVLVADQNAAVALAVADRAYVMQSGRVIAEGAAAELLEGDLLGAALFG